MVAAERSDRKVRTKACAEPCPIERGMRILGGKWTGSILWHLKDGPVRFNELARQLIEAHRTILEMPEDRARPLSAKDAHAAFDGARLGACLCPHLAIRSLRRDHSSTSPLWLQKVYWLIIETCCPKSSHERGL